MAKKYVYFQGKAKWARLVQPDPKFQKWLLSLYFTPKSLDEFRELKLKTHLKKDDDGFFAKLSRPVSKLIKGQNVAFLPPRVFDKDGVPLEGILIGNGSDVTVKCELYQYTPPGAKVKENAIRMESIRVDNLVPYKPDRDLMKDDAKAAEGLSEQPEQVF
jgi:hypothetical protein